MTQPSRETHVIVGDHTPEPRIKHDPPRRPDFDSAYFSGGCASHAPDRDDSYVVPASATHGSR
jgi:hypothetical protein